LRIATLALITFLARGGLAQPISDDAPAVSTRADRNKLALGESFVVTISVLGPDTFIVGLPATLSLGERKSTFYFRGKPTKRDTVDNGAMFVLGTTYVPFEYIEAVAVDGPISVSDGNYTHEEWTHDVKFSIRGLAEGIKILREKCTSPPVDATTPPPELPKNVWNPKGLHLPSDWKPTPRKQ